MPLLCVVAPQNSHMRKRAGFERALEHQGHWSWGCRAGSDLKSPQGAHLCDMRLVAYLRVEIAFDFPPCLGPNTVVNSNQIPLEGISQEVPNPDGGMLQLEPGNWN